MVRISGSGGPFERLEFLWGRCYGLDYQAKSGPVEKCMYQIGFMEGDDAFAFVDPANVLRAVHLIPRFSGNTTDELLGQSMARKAEEKNVDYERYYINIFVDRDMFVRFTGGGIGHQITREATQMMQKSMEMAYSPDISGSVSSSEESDEELLNLQAQEEAGSVTEEDLYKEDEVDNEEEEMRNEDSESEENEEEEEYLEESLGFEAL
ncbi:hypothetical protein C0992_000387 [Termitomyces sp. T32_za158]|nr:hypothetical protein C0992_000387 [Termitomyces sp. T32_za158]